MLVTIYQDIGQPGESAPRLQVLRLAGDPAVAGADAPAAPAVPEREADVMAHIQASGDVPGQFGEWIGKRGSRAWIEGFGISDKGTIAPGDVEYQGVLGRGWQSPWVENGKFCGSRGMALPLLGLKLRDLLSDRAVRRHRRPHGRLGLEAVLRPSDQVQDLS